MVTDGWSVSVEQGKLLSFLTVAAQTLESFVKSLDDEIKTPPEDYNSHEHQFVLALVGTITSESTRLDSCFSASQLKKEKPIPLFYQSDIAAVTCGRDFISSSGHVLLDTLLQLLQMMKPGIFPKLKVYVPVSSCRGRRCTIQSAPGSPSLNRTCPTLIFSFSLKNLGIEMKMFFQAGV